MPDDVVSTSDFSAFLNLFDKKLPEDQTQLHPEAVTDIAINELRKGSHERYLIHYMQPHDPYLHDKRPVPWNESPFDYLKNGGDFEKVWEEYVNNLRLVLDYVELLLDNVDAEKVVITADHGELFGEWGMYTHKVGVPHPNLRKVPWVETTAQDSQSYEPDTTMPEETVPDEVVEKRLEELGYR